MSPSPVDTAAPAAVVFDGDDTLWVTEPLYDSARSAAAKVVESAGIDPVLWDELERVVDVDNVQRLGLSSSRFPTSCVDAYVLAAQSSGAVYQTDVARRVQSAACSVFTSVAPLALGAEELLSRLSGRFELVLYTQGDPEIQEKRILDSGLGRYFSLILVVDHKTTDDLQSVITKLDIPASRFVFVGNSIRSDINPALAVGMNAIWIDRHVWSFEHQAIERGPGRLLEATSLFEAGPLIERTLGAA